MKFDVFGRVVEVLRAGDRWSAYYLGGEGKRRPARDIVIPSDLDEPEIRRYLDDLCHEWATPENPQVTPLD